MRGPTPTKAGLYFPLSTFCIWYHINIQCFVKRRYVSTVCLHPHHHWYTSQKLFVDNYHTMAACIFCRIIKGKIQHLSFQNTAAENLDASAGVDARGVEGLV